MHTVNLAGGIASRRFAFGNSVNPSYSITANQNSLPLYKEAIYSAFQAVVEGTGAVTATIAIHGSVDDDTGRGVIHGGNTAPGLRVGTTNTSTTMTSPDAAFTADMVGLLVDCPGVPTGTTVSAVASGGASLTLSAAATATKVDAQAIFRDIVWAATALGTITLSGTTLVTDGFQTTSSWRFIRAVVTNVTGTGATVRVWMGV